MELIVKFGLMFLSMTGYFVWGRDRLRLRLEFMPAVFCACVSNLLFVAGIHNLLPQMGYLIYFGGFAALLLSLKKLKRIQLDEWVFLAVFLGIAVAYCLYFRGLLLTGYDDFSHWGIAAKDIILRDVMPRESGTKVGFQAYPLGSTLFIYYIGHIVGKTDAVMLWSQLFFELSLLAAVFGVSSKKRFFPAIAVFSIYALLMNTRFMSLNVDTLLALAPIAGFALMYVHRDRPELSMAMGGLFSMLAVNIKNSGVFFGIALVVLSFWQHRKRLARDWKRFLFTCALPPLATVILWNRHVDLVLPGALESKHAMDLTRYMNVAQGKSPELVRTIADGMCKRFFSFNDVIIQTLLLCYALLMLLCILQKMQSVRRQIAAAGAMTLTAVLYELGILGMYVFSMPDYEAGILASYARYEATCALFLLGVALVYALHELSRLEWKGWRGAMPAALMLALLCVPLYPLRDATRLFYTRPDQTGTDRYKMVQMNNALDLEMDKDYLFYRKNQDHGLLGFIANYELWARAAWVTTETDVARENAYKYDYLIVWDTADSDLEPFMDLGTCIGEAAGVTVFRIEEGARR